MASPIDRASSLALTLFVGLAAYGCGGNSGSQPTSVERTLKLVSGNVYPSTAGAVASSVQPLVTFSANSDQRVTLWGTRAEDGRIASVYESAYTSAKLQNLKDGAHTIYSRYDVSGNLLSLLDSVTGAYITFSEFIPAAGSSSNGSIMATGYDPAKDKTARVRATLTGGNITVAVLEDGSRAKETRTFRLSDLDPALGTVRVARSEAGAGALTGFLSVYQGSAPRTMILATVFKAAALAVEDGFGGIVADSGGFLLLDQLTTSYADLTDRGITPELAAEGEMPMSAYRNDLPMPMATS